MLRFRILIICLFLATLAYSQDKKIGTKPNIIIILCDDLGRGDLGAYGHPIIKTPNLDKMAKKGILFTDCYASSPVCSPSRAGLITGRIPNRTGVYDWIASSGYLKAEEVTIAEQLKKAGYATGLFGKWHLNSKFNHESQPNPGDQGFDYWFATKNNASPNHKNPRNFVRNQEKAGEIKGFSAYIVADEFNDWVETQNRENPFFAFITFHEPHLPIASDPALVAKYKNKAKVAGQDEYYANVAQMDKAVGSIMAQLKSLGQDQNTLIFFTSDNGPETWMRYKGAWLSHGTPGKIDGTPLRGMKLHVSEGGIRVPGILYWPAMVKKGRKETQPISALDLFPTLSALVNVPLPENKKLDGTNILPLLRNEKINREQPLFWFYYNAKGPNNIALRKGDFVLLSRRSGEQYREGTGFTHHRMPAIKDTKPNIFELYHLREDIGQTFNIEKKYPRIFEEMKEEMIRIFTDVQQESPIWTEEDH